VLGSRGSVRSSVTVLPAVLQSPCVADHAAPFSPPGYRVSGRL